MNPRYYNIECLRFLLSLIIVYYHLLHASIVSRSPVPHVYDFLKDWSSAAGIAVEAFLIIGGYFIYISTKKNINKSFLEVALNRFIRLWPVMAFYTIINLIFFKLDWENAFFILRFYMLQAYH